MRPRAGLAVAAHVLLGIAAEREQMLDLAYSHYELALRLDPRPELAAKIRRNLVSLDARRGRWESAIAHAEALSQPPKVAVSLEQRVADQCLLAHLHARKGDAIRSVQLLRGVIAAHDPDYTKYARAQLDRLVATTIDAEALR